MDSSSKDAEFRGKVSPVFYSRSGEPASLPSRFQDAVVRITAAASCGMFESLGLLFHRATSAVVAARPSNWSYSFISGSGRS